jgi:2-polyprenyl-6-methoxyphenol hydroxylase-like FAD-dependent oxidoreductase
MRVLIIGGGMAGWTLAGHLLRAGITPTIVERVPEYSRVGFCIGLYPFSANTLRPTGVYDRYAKGSLPVTDYTMCDGHGSVMQQMSMAEVLGRIQGFMGMLQRADLLDILQESGVGADVRMGTTVTALEQDDAAVTVTISDGGSGEYDVVLACDGIHSATRALLVGHADQGLTDWGFTAFTWWTPRQDVIGDGVVEYWGAGGLFGLYPLEGRINAIAGMPTPAGLGQMSQEQIVAVVREHFRDYPDPVKQALVHATDDTVFPWPMVDQKAERWIHGRVALVGDAATGFLPTAGVGASNAIKSAQVLADELGRADASTVPLALDLWEKRARDKVEANQAASRTLAKMMFVKGNTIAKARDVMLKHYPVEKVAKDIVKSNTEPW